jgi:phenylacetic acid degradation operon negative regulatory protein
MHHLRILVHPPTCMPPAESYAAPMKNATVDKWIRQFLESDPPRAKSVVMTVFGDAITPHGGQAWLGSLIALLAPLGLNDRLVRTSVFRLAEEGWLDAQREGRRSRYQLTATGRRRFERAHDRIYVPAETKWDGKWTLLLSAPETITAAERAQLRRELLWEGFGLIAPGMFGHPCGRSAALQEILERVQIAGKVFVCTASDSREVSTRPLADLVARCWDMERVMSDYRDFIKSFQPVARHLDKRRALDPEQAFVLRTLLIHAFRRVQLHDPLLPLALLPDDWPGTVAYDLCRRIYERAWPRAEGHIVTTLAREEGTVSQADAEFFKRFGGLSKGQIDAR